MILGFKKHFPDGTPTNFKDKILNGTIVNVKHPHLPKGLPDSFLYKIHTLREDPLDRWQAGNTIQMAYGVRTKHYEQFNKGIDELEKCVSTQDVFMSFIKSRLEISIDDKYYYNNDLLIRNDGLNYDQFINWFFPEKKETWGGKIIHWTNFRY